MDHFTVRLQTTWALGRCDLPLPTRSPPAFPTVPMAGPLAAFLGISQNEHKAGFSDKAFPPDVDAVSRVPPTVTIDTTCTESS